LAPAVELIVQDFHGLALSSLAVVVPTPTMMLELQSVERIMLVSSLVDVDVRQLRVSALEERVARDENCHMELNFVWVPKTQHGRFNDLS
jgi:hypothetical protein